MPNTSTSALALGTGTSTGGGGTGIGSSLGGAGGQAFGIPAPIGAAFGAKAESLFGGGKPATQLHGRYSVGGHRAVMEALIAGKRWESADLEEKTWVSMGFVGPTGHTLGGLAAKHGRQADFSPISVKLPNGETISVGTERDPASAKLPAAPLDVGPATKSGLDAKATTSPLTLFLIAGGFVVFLVLLFLLLR